MTHTTHSARDPYKIVDQIQELVERNHEEPEVVNDLAYLLTLLEADELKQKHINAAMRRHPVVLRNLCDLQWGP